MGITITAVLFPSVRANVFFEMENFWRGGDPGSAAIYQTLNGRIV